MKMRVPLGAAVFAGVAGLATGGAIAYYYFSLRDQQSSVNVDIHQESASTSASVRRFR